METISKKPSLPAARPGWRRFKELAACLALSAAVSCSSASKIPDGQKAEAPSCRDSARLSDDNRLRMPQRCWVEINLMGTEDVSFLLAEAAHGKRAQSGIPAPGPVQTVIRDTDSALAYLRTEGAREISVLQHVKSASEVDVSRELQALEPYYRGRALSGRLATLPPFAVEIDFGSPFESELEKAFAGKYFVGTNLLVLNPRGMLAHEVFRSQVAGHELMHYLSWLSHSGNYFYTGSDSRGPFIATDRSMWMEEGFASLVAYRLFADACEKVPYPHFTSSALLIEHVAGFDAVAEAAVSGDMRGIERSLDQKFPGIDFNALANGSYLGGPLFFPLMESARRSGMDELADAIAKDGMIKKICDSPPKDYSCPP